MYVRILLDDSLLSFGGWKVCRLILRWLGVAFVY